MLFPAPAQRSRGGGYLVHPQPRIEGEQQGVERKVVRVDHGEFGFHRQGMAGVLEFDAAVGECRGRLVADAAAQGAQLLPIRVRLLLLFQIGRPGPGRPGRAAQSQKKCRDSRQTRLPQPRVEQGGSGDTRSADQQMGAAHQQQLPQVAQADEVGISQRQVEDEDVEDVKEAEPHD